MATKAKKSLLEKHNIPVNRLSYEYVEDCSDIRELELIVKILRSGEEGVYPDLIKRAECRLEKLNPSSRALRKQDEVLRPSSLDNEKWQEVSSQFKDWSTDIQKSDLDLHSGSTSVNREPKTAPIRGNGLLREPTVITANNNVKEKKSVAEAPKQRKPVPRSFAEWDKFDAEGELVRIEAEEESGVEKRELAKKKKQREAAKITEVTSETSTASGESSQPRVLKCEAERVALAEREKLKGNECFNAKDYEQAVQFFSNSVSIQPSASVYTNRALCYYRLERYSDCVTDCDWALRLDRCSLKALFRRASALHQLGRWRDALQDVHQALKISPKSQDMWKLKKMLETSSEDRARRMCIEEVPLLEKEPPFLQSPTMEVSILDTLSRSEESLGKRVGDLSYEDYNFENMLEEIKTKRIENVNEYLAGEINKVERAKKENTPKIVEVDASIEEVNSSAVPRVEEELVNKSIIEETEIITDKAEIAECEVVISKQKNKKKVKANLVEGGLIDAKVEEVCKEKLVEDFENVGHEIGAEKAEFVVVNNKQKKRKRKKKKGKVKFVEDEVCINVVNSNVGEGVKEDCDEAKQDKDLVKTGVVLENRECKEEVKVRLGDERDIDDIVKELRSKFGVMEVAREVESGRVEGVEVLQEKEELEASVRSCHEGLDSVMGSGDGPIHATRHVEEGSFLLRWTTLRDPTYLQHAKLLHKISPANLSKAVGSSLDDTMLSAFLACIDHHRRLFPSSLRREYLTAISRLERFSFIHCFMSPEDKTAVKNIIHHLREEGEEVKEAVEALFNL